MAAANLQAMQNGRGIERDDPSGLVNGIARLGDAITGSGGKFHDNRDAGRDRDVELGARGVDRPA